MSYSLSHEVRELVFDHQGAAVDYRHSVHLSDIRIEQVVVRYRNGGVETPQDGIPSWRFLSMVLSGHVILGNGQVDRYIDTREVYPRDVAWLSEDLQALIDDNRPTELGG